MDRRPARFATTHWSVVLTTGSDRPSAVREALETLCQSYWYPLYAFARRRGRTAEQAEDAVQEFLAQMLDGRRFERADPARGRFRSFLLTCFRNHLGQSAERRAALKRGGGRRVLSLDRTAAEARLQLEPAHAATPERLFDRSWALTVLEQVMRQLRERYAARDDLRRFELLSPVIAGRGDVDHAALAAALDATEGAVRVMLHRLRQRYRALLEETILQTLADPGELKAEVGSLMEALEAV